MPNFRVGIIESNNRIYIDAIDFMNVIEVLKESQENDDKRDAIEMIQTAFETVIP